MSNSFEEEVLTMLGGLFGGTADGAGVLVEIAGRAIPLSEFRELLARVEKVNTTPAIPARGSVEYVATLNTVAILDHQEMVTASLHGLWDDFGWRGVLDMMVMWIIQMESSPYLRDRCRDMFGVVDLTKIICLGGGPQYALERATEYVQEALAENPEARPHEELDKALAMSERTIELGHAWLPFIHSAFAAAHQDRYNQRAVFAALFRGPYRDDKIRMIQLGVIIGTAALGVRHFGHLSDRYGRDAEAASLKWGDIVAAAEDATHRPTPRHG